MIPLTRPTVPSAKSLLPKLQRVLKSGMLTNSRYVEEFEKKCARFLGTRDAVAVSHGTSALMLAAKCLGLTGEVILPSFTFTSTGHALLWNNLTPVFADIDSETCNIDPAGIERKITKKTCAIMATHVFGSPCDIAAIERIAKKHNLKTIYDAAHAFGATFHKKSVACFGDAAIFSLTPTKVFSTGEGGLATAKNKKITHLLRLGRNNGDSFNKAEEFLGITARLSEFSAILGIETLKAFKKNLSRRKRMVALYHKELRGVPGIRFQKQLPNTVSTHKEAAIMVDEKAYGISRDHLLKELNKRNIQAKVYFYPPLHQKKVYAKFKHTSLPRTDYVVKHIMSLPLYSHMPKREVREVCAVIKRFAK